MPGIPALPQHRESGILSSWARTARNDSRNPVWCAKGTWGMMGVPGGRGPHFLARDRANNRCQAAPRGIGVVPAL